MSYRSIINLVILTAGLSLSSVTAYLLYKKQVSETLSRAAFQAQDHSQAIRRSIDLSRTIGQSFHGFFTSSVHISKEEFRSFARLFLNDYPFIKGISWNPRVSLSARQQFVSQAAREYAGYRITERGPDGSLIEAQKRSEYFPVYFIEPATGNEKARGFDVASEALRLSALTYARLHNTPSITGRIRLVQDTEGQWSVLMFFPVFEGGISGVTDALQPDALTGFIVIVCDIPVLIEQSLRYLRPAGFNFTVYDASADESERFLYFHASRTQSADRHNTDVVHGRPTASNSLNVFNRRWAFDYDAVPGHYDISPGLEVVLVLLGGMTISLLLFVYLRLVEKREIELQSQQERLERIVEERTRDLRNSNRDLESYSYSIAHDLRTPLRAIVGFSQIIEESCKAKLDEEEKDYLKRIVSAGKHMAQLLEDILELSRISRSKLERQPVNLTQLCQKFSRQMETVPASQPEVSWKIEADMHVFADPRLMTVVMDNLLNNARKFSAKNPAPEISVGTIRQQGEEVYYVRDNGVGFDMAHAGHLFRVFHRLHLPDEFEGTGIGLATVQRIVDRHGGRIWAESAPGQGATFYFTLAGRVDEFEKFHMRSVR